MKDGVPTGEYDDFLVGFIVDDGNAWGRPVALLVNADGSLLLTDDGAISSTAFPTSIDMDPTDVQIKYESRCAGWPGRRHRCDPGARCPATHHYSEW
ncbi:MAG: hypothetical protein WDM77_14975 [Steroidobacteraceae bacterium]